MSIVFTKTEGADLLNLIEKLDETEWQKCSNSQYEIKEHGLFVIKDQSSIPPSVCFRFKNEKEEIIERLKSIVNSYHGKVAWKVHGRQRDGLPGFNWCIEPLKVIEATDTAHQLKLSPKQYIEKIDPEFGPIAYEDLIGLTEHIRSAFEDLL